MQFRNVNLSPDLDEFVLNSLESGHYSNVSELVQAALRALDHEERMKKLSWHPRPGRSIRAQKTSARATFSASSGNCNLSLRGTRQGKEPNSSFHLSGVGSTLPGYLLEDFVLEPASVEQHDEQRKTQRRNRAICKREVRLGHPCIEPDQRAQPQNGQYPSGTQPSKRFGCKMRVP